MSDFMVVRKETPGVWSFYRKNQAFIFHAAIAEGDREDHGPGHARSHRHQDHSQG
jgi:hypothetical protein